MADRKPAKKTRAAADKRVYFSQGDFPQTTLQQAQKIASALVAVRRALEAHNRKTLESEYGRFLAAYRSGLLMRLRSRLSRFRPRAAA